MIAYEELIAYKELSPDDVIRADDEYSTDATNWCHLSLAWTGETLSVLRTNGHGTSNCRVRRPIIATYRELLNDDILAVDDEYRENSEGTWHKIDNESVYGMSVQDWRTGRRNSDCMDWHTTEFRRSTVEKAVIREWTCACNNKSDVGKSCWWCGRASG